MRIRQLRPAVAEADMTPMIDMVFQLIAFFMIVTNFEQMQADERVKLPIDQLAVPPNSPREDDIVINVGMETDEDTGERVPCIYYGDENIPVLKSASYFQRELSRQLALEKELNEVTIVIRADKQVPTGPIQEMMRIAQEVGDGQGFTRFSLKAQQGEDEPLLE